MPAGFTVAARRLGIVSALAVVLFELLYAIALAIGFLSLDSAGQPIGDPIFSILEALIVVTAPFLVGLMVAVHAWAPAPLKPFGRRAIVFAGLLAGTTALLHVTILVLSGRPAFADWQAALSFRWPSVAYALDILAWDLFFPLSALCAAVVFDGDPLARTIRTLLIASGLLALAGLAGPLTGDMRLRNIGIAGYVGLFPIAVTLLALLFRGTRPANGNQFS